MKWSLAVAFSMLVSTTALADCQWEWLCKGDGSACKQMPVCDTLYEKPGPRPGRPNRRRPSRCARTSSPAISERPPAST